MDFKQYRLDVDNAVDLNLRVTYNLIFHTEKVGKSWYVYDKNKKVHNSYFDQQEAESAVIYLNNKYEDVVKAFNRITENDLTVLSEELAYVE